MTGGCSSLGYETHLAGLVGPTADDSKFTALALSINLWVFAAISGVDYFKIDLVKGNQATAKVGVRIYYKAWRGKLMRFEASLAHISNGPDSSFCRQNLHLAVLQEDLHHS